MRKSALLSCLFVLSFATPVAAADQPSLKDVSHLALPGGPMAAVDPRLKHAQGEVEVVVRLGDVPLAVAQGEGAKKRGGKLTPGQQREHLAHLSLKHDDLARAIRALGGREIARVSKALNAVILRVDASHIQTIAGFPNVISIRPVIDYKLDLIETVPYIGAKAAQDAGFDGTGVTVALLDSGIDYTHKNFGGPGTAEAYADAYGTDTDDVKNTTLDGLFPTAKVIGGYDFVGEVWPDGPLLPDPDPIDFGGHGTHVADIIGGASLDGAHKGVAPGVKFYALKVCSAVSSSCSGIALLQAMDFALDPNGDGDISDAVDVINMSLGSAYGQREDDLSEASANAVRLGVVVVAAAGNDGDRPYVTSSPASTPEVISVAQTQVPSAKRYPLIVNSPAAISGQYKNTETVSWAPVGAGFTGDVAYVGRGCPADAVKPGDPEDPYLANPAGKVALIDRGGCAVSLKVDRAARAGAIGVILGLVAPGDPISFSRGGGDTFVPTLVITKEVADRLKANLAAPVNVTVSPAVFIPLVGGVVPSSARGPSYSYNAIKPDIAAPGASVSALVGTGDGQEGFGGTSGATPMVAGSAALLIQAYPDRGPAEIKALLMNTAEINIQTDPALGPGVPAPITRIGGGEVRVDRALKSKTAAWDADALSGSLSFGYHAVSGHSVFTRRVTVRNYSNHQRTFTVAPQFRYADDAASKAVTVQAPSHIFVPANSSASFNVCLSVNASQLPMWDLNGGDLGGEGDLLQGLEFDGYLNVSDGADNVHLAWQILPHRAAEVQPIKTTVAVHRGSSGTLLLSNRGGAVDGRVEVFSLTGTSPQIRRKLLPGPGDNFAIIDLKSVGTRLVDIGGGEFGIQFAINNYGERAHPNYPAELDVLIDANRDGTPDFDVFNSELGPLGSSGQNVVNVLDLNTGDLNAYFFTDADLNSADAILTAPLSAVGLTPDTRFDFSIFAFDNYFTGNVTDSIEGMTYTPQQPRFIAFGVPDSGVPAGGASLLNIVAVPGGETASPSQLGLLLLYRDGKPGREADAIRVGRHP